MQKQRVVTIDEGEHAAVGAYSILAVKIFEVVAVNNEVLHRVHQMHMVPPLSVFDVVVEIETVARDVLVLVVEFGIAHQTDQFFFSVVPAFVGPGFVFGGIEVGTGGEV